MPQSNDLGPIVERLDILIRLFAGGLIEGEATLLTKIRKLEAMGIVDRGQLASICGTSRDVVAATINREKRKSAPETASGDS